MELKESDFPPVVMESADAAAVAGTPLAGSFIRMMSAAESDAYEESRVTITYDDAGKVKGQRNVANIRARLLVRTLCDAQGKRHFADDYADTLGRLLPRDRADKLFDQASRVNGLDQREPEKNVPPAADASPSA
jgi:hypothetical protein